RSRNSSKWNREKCSLRPPHSSQEPTHFSRGDGARSIHTRLIRVIIDDGLQPSRARITPRLYAFRNRDVPREQRAPAFVLGRTDGSDVVYGNDWANGFLRGTRAYRQSA